MKLFLSILFTSFFAMTAQGRQVSSFADTIRNATLPDVTVKAFHQNKKIWEIAAAVNYINSVLLQRFDNTNILPAINATAGVRMEERSPGSYRLNIRGSSLRSPFGIRNVKVYYNDIPLTDAGGVTYLNQLGFYNVTAIEVVKGPGSSLYGAGTGGVILLNGLNSLRKKGWTFSQSNGSYASLNSYASLCTGNDSFKHIISYQHLSNSGYRDHSTLRKDIFSWAAEARHGRNNVLSGSFFYSDLYYQTPGALTLAEYEQQPAAARPGIGSVPGAREADAAIYQKTVWGGMSSRYTISDTWSNFTSLYGAVTLLNNPAIRNYARNIQPHYGGRTFFTFYNTPGQYEVLWHSGGEIQEGFTGSKVYKNKGGRADSLQTDDEINTHTWFAFTQLSVTYKDWIATAGASLNHNAYHFARLGSLSSADYRFSFGNEVAPRLSLLRKINNRLSVYGAWSKGFSPPSTDEMFPSGSLINAELSAEKGYNYEVGIKGEALARRLSFDVSFFYFLLHNTIVQRRDNAGGDYYINAGSTRQPGLETQLSYKLLNEKNTPGKTASVFISEALYQFRYYNFRQQDNDYSGNDMPGVPKHFFTAGMDASWRGCYMSITYQYSGSIPLNDGNTAIAKPYHLLSSKIGYKNLFKKIEAEIYVGGNNLLNKKYSLGNDINAFGGRYYNSASPVSLYMGLMVGFSKK